MADPQPAPDDSEPVPRLPRGRGMKLSGPELFRILLTGGMLVALLVLAKPCSDAVSGFVMRFDKGSASKQMPKPGNVDKPAEPPHGVLIRADMTDDEKRAAIEKARQEAAGSAVPGVGSAVPGVGVGSGSGSGSGSTSTSTNH